MISNFRGKYFFLSNFYGHPVEYEGITYANNEAAFQSAKIKRGDRVENRRTYETVTRETFASLSPNEAKRLGRSIVLREDWEDVKVKVMATIVVNKFKDPVLRRKLLDTGDEELVEGNTWGDHYWGVCDGQGLNALGKILMAVRNSERKKGY